MKLLRKAGSPVAWLAGLTLLVAQPAQAQVQAQAEGGKSGPIREMLKERLLERQKNKPPPQASGPAGMKLDKPGDYVFNISFGGLTRFYTVHVPKGYSAQTAVPLLVALHGGGGDMQYQADDKYYGLVPKADREGFVVVFPNGYSELPSGKLATWNAGTCCAGARDRKIDDVGFVRQVVANVQAQLNIDRRRVYASGMSNGGMLAYRLACEASDTFKAIAAVAGTDNTTACTPKNPVAVLHMHAKNDDRVLFNGGAGAKFTDKSLVANFTSVPDTVAKWVGLNGCTRPARRTLEKPGAYCEVYAPCRAGAQVQLCVTDSGGHSWPGGGKTPLGGTPTTALSANDVMWAFFRQL